MGFDYRTSTGLGKQTHGGHKQNLVCTRTPEKGAVTPQETDPDSPVSDQGPPDVARVSRGLLQCWGHWHLLKEVAIVFITSTIVSVQFSRSVVSDSLRPHESQHVRHPCPSPTLEFTQTHIHRVGDAIQRSHALFSPFSSCPQSLPASESFPMTQHFA